jgi:hypothetical protein
MATNYYKAEFGITDGMTHYVDGAVFAGSPALDKHFEDTGGKDGERVLYVKSSKEDYDKYNEERSATATPFPDVVGSLPTGEASLLDTQKSGDTALEADSSVGEPSEGEPVPFDGPEAERRATGDAEVAAEAPAAKAKAKATSDTTTA